MWYNNWGVGQQDAESRLRTQWARESEMLKDFRRIVTGHNEHGKSVIAMDGPAGAIVGTDETGLADFWVTDSAPADNTSEGDAANRPVKLEPPPQGSVFRYFIVRPEDPAMSTEQLEQVTAMGMASIGAAHCRVDTRRHPGMHKTHTVDYILVMKGTVTMLVDEGEVDLKPYDVVVQRGTNHAWVNKGSEPALLAAILIDAESV